MKKQKKIKFRSRFEGKVAQSLIDLEAYWHYEQHQITYTRVCKYTPDFVCHTSKGKIVYIEAKGRFTSTDRSKMLIIKRDNPDLDIRILFMSPGNKLNKSSKTSYAQWASKHGFIWAKGPKVPEEWLI